MPALVSEPAPPEIKELMVNALAGVVPLVVTMTSVAEAPRVPPVIVAAPVLLLKSTPPVPMVRRPPSVRV